MVNIHMITYTSVHICAVHKQICTCRILESYIYIYIHMNMTQLEIQSVGVVPVVPHTVLSQHGTLKRNIGLLSNKRTIGLLSRVASH